MHGLYGMILYGKLEAGQGSESIKTITVWHNLPAGLDVDLAPLGFTLSGKV